MTEAGGFVLIALGILVLFVLGLRRRRRDSPFRLKPPPLPPKEDKQLDGFAELARAGQAARARAESYEKVRRWLLPFGVFGRLATYAALSFALYIHYTPKDITHTPLASLTLSDILGIAGYILMWVVLIRAFFNPSEDETIKDVWDWLGLSIVGLAFFALAVLVVRHW